MDAPALFGRACLLALLTTGVSLETSPAVAAKGESKTPTAAHHKARLDGVRSRSVPPKRPPRSKSVSHSKSTRQAKEPQRIAPKSIPADIRELGPLSVGHPHAGYLINGVELPSRDDWVVTVPSHGYGTQETNDALALCIGKVRREIPNSPRVKLGSLSAERGGHLPPHKSHRTGRDVDVYFFRQPGAQWSKAATQQDIDLKRTWALLRCFVAETDVEMILIDEKVQGWLEAHALAKGEDSSWVRELFHDQGSYKTSIVRHVPGHVAHMHVRFESPRARRAGVQHYDRLVAAGLVVPERRAIVHEVRKGDTLGHIAQRYDATVAEIQRLNALETTVIRIGQKLTLKQPIDIRGARNPVSVRARHLPPGMEPTEAAPAAAAPGEPVADDDAASTDSAPPGPPPVQASEAPKGSARQVNPLS